MLTHFRSASQRLRSWFASPQRRPIRREKPHKRLRVEQLEERALPSGSNLNSVIDNLLLGFSSVNLPSPSDTFTYTNATVGTSVAGGTADLELKQVSLSFPNLTYAGGSWTGDVVVTAQSGVLFPGLLDIAVADGTDVDAFGVVGDINLAQGNANSYLKLDPIDGSTIGIPNFLDVNFQDLRLNFTDFRGNDNLNSLHFEFQLKGFDTGDAFLNSQLQGGNNPFIQINVEGFASGTIDLPAVESVATNAASFQVALADEALQQLDGFGGKINGKIFKIGNMKADFFFHQITVDGRSAGYIAVEGGMSFGGEEWGRSGDFEVAFAISDLGPLQFFGLGGPIETPWGMEIEEVRFGTVFNQTIEGLRTAIDASAIAATAAPEGPSGSRVTLTMSANQQHDLVIGDHFRIAAAPNTAYNGEFTVVDVDGNKVTYEDDLHTPAALGVFTGSANIIRLTIRTPLDLRDSGLTQLFTPPRSMFDWRNQLDLQVTNQIHAGQNVWNQLFGKMIFGGGTTITIEGISGKVMKVNADVALDTNGSIFITGNLALGGGAAKIPASIYADLTKLQSGAAKFIFLADVPKIPGVSVDPLLVYRGSVGFQALLNGAPVGLDPSGLPAGEGVNVTSATVTRTGPWTVTFNLTLPAGTNVSDKFKVGDTLVVVNSNPDKFNGKHVITAIDDTAGTVSFRIGMAVKNGGIDVNLDGVIDAADDGLFNQIPVIDGKLDMDRNGVVNNDDDGGVSLFMLNLATTDLTDYQRSDYQVINGLVDIDHDGDVNADSGDVGAIGTEPGTWVSGSAVANQSAFGDGFRITIGGGIDLNIPKVTTISLETVTDTVLDFTIPGPGSAIDARMDLSFDGQLHEKNVGQIARFAGNFHVTIDSDIPVDATHPVGGVEIWGAGLLTSDLKFLEKYGLFASASGLLRINSGDIARQEVLPVANGPSITVALPAKSFAMRLDGNVDFRIDFDKSGSFTADESMALFQGVFVVDFSAEQGFNVAFFRENTPGVITPATIQLGPPALLSGARLLTAEALGFLALRSKGVAADIYVGLTAQSPPLPLGLAKLTGQAVLIANTTGQPVSFTVPGGASNPNQPAPGSTLVIPAAAPAKPSDILGAASSATNPQFEALKTSSPTWVAQPTAGPYGVMFIKGNINLLGVLDNELAGYVLLSTNVVSIEANYKAERNFLNLVSGSVSGSLFFSSQGEFELKAKGTAQLGPDGFNINGSACLTISYLDSDGKGSEGDGQKTLEVTGKLKVGATVFYVPLGTIGLDVRYKEPSITVSVTVPVPDIAWTDPDPVFGVSWPYPTIVNKPYSFTVGTLTVNPVPPPPVVLASNTGGALRLNVGPYAGERNYNPTELDEVVTVERVAAGSVSGDKIQVTMFGISQQYDNVTSISADMGDGDDSMFIDNGVTVPVVAHLGAGADTLTNKTAAFVTAYGEAGRDRLTGGSGTDWLYGGDDSDTIDGGAGADVIEGGAGNDFLIGGDGSDTIKGDAGQDLIAGDLGQVTGTVAGIVFSSQASASGGADTIYGGRGADIIFGGSGGDTIYGEGEDDTLLGGDGQATIGSTIVVVPLALGSDGADTFYWKTGDGNDTIDGQLGSDTLNVDATAGASTGTLTSSRLSGLGMTTGITYSGLETVNINLSAAADTFNVNSTNSTTTTTINAGNGADTVNVGSNAPSTGGNINGIAGKLVIQGGGDSDILKLDDTSDTAANTGTLTATQITGLGMGSDGITYAGLETLNVNLGSGGDTFNVQSTASGTVNTVNTGAGDDQVTAAVAGIATGPFNINTEGDDDVIVVNLANPSVDLTININGGPPSASDAVIVNGTAGSDSITVDGLTVTSGLTKIPLTAVETLTANLLGNADSFIVTSTSIPTFLNGGDGADTYTVNATGLGGPLTLDGQGNADIYNLNLGSLAAAVSVADSGASGSDALNVNGIAGANNIVLDYATMTRDTELVNYTGIESLQIDTHAGADIFTILDNGAVTTINSDSGDDEFTIGPAANEDGEVIDANGNGTNTDELAINGTSFLMTINGGDDSDDFEVNRNTAELFLNGQNGDDVFVLNTLITGGDSTVDSGSGTDTITYLQNSPVHINGGDGFDTIIVNGSKLDDVFIITGTTVEVVGSRVVDYVEIESLEVNGRKGMDTFTVDTTIDGHGNVLATSGLQMLAVNGQQDNDLVELRGMLADITATFNGGAGSDTFNLGSQAPVTVNAIDGPVTINGDDDQDTLNVYDTGDTAANTGVLTGTTLTGLGMANGVTYGTLEALTIALGSGGNTFTIQDTHIGTTEVNSGSGSDTVNVKAVLGPTTVNAEAGPDTINVGSLAPAAGGTVNPIAAALTVNGGANADTLNLDDTEDASPNSGVLTATQLTGLGMGAGITYGALETLYISLGAGGNSFNVQATAAGTATTLNSGNGDDVLTVDSNGAAPDGTVDGVVSSLTINGQSGFNVLTTEDYSDTTGDTVHVTPTQIGAAAGDTFFGPGGLLTYGDLDQVTLNMSQAYLPDTIYLTPSRGTEFFIRGRDPQTPMQRAQLSGDALYLDFTGLTAAERLGVRLNATGLNNPADPLFNVWNIPGYGNVNYKQIEKMNHVQTLAIGADGGGQEPRVRVIDAETGVQKLSFLAFDAKGGVRVAVGDVNGDAIPDIITSAGPGGGPEVRVYNGATGARFTEPIGDFFAFQGNNTTVYVAVADFNMDGLADIVTSSDSGDPIVKVFDSYKLLTGPTGQPIPVLSQFPAYDRHITGGARLAVGDLTGDGVPDIAAAPVSGLRSEVRIFATSLSADQATVTHSLLTSFTAFPKYNGPINIAVGDVTGDGRADIVVGTDSGGSALVRIYDGATISSGPAPTPLVEFAPYGKQSGGVRLALVDLDGDGVNELITASALIGSKVKPKAFDFSPDGLGGLTPVEIDAFFASYASDPFFQGALYLGGGN